MISQVVTPRYISRYSRSGAIKMAKNVQQLYDYLLVTDFEATCDQKIKLKPQVGLDSNLDLI